MIDIIIPTMWAVSTFIDALTVYTSSKLVNKIIIIDNDKRNRPKAEILTHPKIELVSYGKNIYVNPAWNEGVRRAKTDIIAIINDDIIVDESVFKMVCDFKLSPGDLIGVNLRGYQNNYKIDDYIHTEEQIVKMNYDSSKPVGGQAWAFGICMFMLRESYIEIPQLYQVWYGDDYLAQRAKYVYGINSNKIKGKISETLVKHMAQKESDINRRVELDSRNFLRFGHFKNSDNWDIPKHTIENAERNKMQLGTFEKEYIKATQTPSDINENLHILHELAKQCDTVVELGVRTGVSTRAFLNSNVQLMSFDIVLDSTVAKLFEIAKEQGKSVDYIQADVLNIKLGEMDMLFIDTLHNYEQLSKELELHGNKAKKFIAFHDTNTFGLKDETKTNGKGLLPAIIEFVIKNPHWVFKIFKTNNNGMTVLERKYIDN